MEIIEIVYTDPVPECKEKGSLTEYIFAPSIEAAKKYAEASLPEVKRLSFYVLKVEDWELTKINDDGEII